MRMRDLERLGYRLKYTSVGWWVDGACGYLVSGYHDTRAAAVRAANRARTAALQSTWYERPVFLFPWESA